MTYLRGDVRKETDDLKTNVKGGGGGGILINTKPRNFAIQKGSNSK